MSTYPIETGIHRYRGVICCAVYALALFAATHISLGQMKEHEFYVAQKEYYIDKAVQFLAYGLFTVLVGLAFVPVSDDPSETVKDLHGQRMFRVGLAVGLFGLLDEGTQPYFGRNFELADCAANVMGIAFGLVGFIVLNEIRSHLED